MSKLAGTLDAVVSTESRRQVACSEIFSPKAGFQTALTRKADLRYHRQRRI